MNTTKRVLAAGIIGSAALVGVLTTPAFAASTQETGTPAKSTPRKLDLSNMASPTVYMVQEIDSTGSYGGSSEGDNPYWENFGHLAASEFMN